MQPIEAAIGPKTKAVIALHNYGHPADMAPILEIANKHGLKVIENVCHALGALYKGKPVGSYGDAGFLSVSHKILSVCGTGRIVLTDDEAIASTIYELRLHGRKGAQELHRDYEMQNVGYNFHMTEMSAAVGAKQLDVVESWNVTRRAVADMYTSLLEEADLPLKLLVEKDYATRVYLHYVVRVPRVRDELKAFLADQDIEAKVHYPIATHLQAPIVAVAGQQGPFPVTEQSCAEVLSLPCHPGMDDSRIQYVVDAMRRVFA